MRRLALTRIEWPSKEGFGEGLTQGNRFLFLRVVHELKSRILRSVDEDFKVFRFEFADNSDKDLVEAVLQFYDIVSLKGILLALQDIYHKVPSAEAGIRKIVVHCKNKCGVMNDD